MSAAGHQHQDELALSSVRSHAQFPGRTSLYVFEVARALEMSEQQVLDLIQEWVDTGGRGGLMAVNIGSELRSETNRRGNKTPRKYWRIPVSAYDEFVTRRSATNQAKTLP